jgi:hypothetical protein
MKKNKNQSGEIVISVGDEFSPIRMKETYNLTFDKCMEYLKSGYKSGLKIQHLSDNILLIIDKNKVKKEHQMHLYDAVTYYFFSERK